MDALSATLKAHAVDERTRLISKSNKGALMKESLDCGTNTIALHFVVSETDAHQNLEIICSLNVHP